MVKNLQYGFRVLFSTAILELYTKRENSIAQGAAATGGSGWCCSCLAVSRGLRATHPLLGGESSVRTSGCLNALPGCFTSLSSVSDFPCCFCLSPCLLRQAENTMSPVCAVTCTAWDRMGLVTARLWAESYLALSWCKNVIKQLALPTLLISAEVSCGQRSVSFRKAPHPHGVCPSLLVRPMSCGSAWALGVIFIGRVNAHLSLIWRGGNLIKVPSGVCQNLPTVLWVFFHSDCNGVRDSRGAFDQSLSVSHQFALTYLKSKLAWFPVS